MYYALLSNSKSLDILSTENVTSTQEKRQSMRHAEMTQILE